jgi:TonB family protein
MRFLVLIILFIPLNSISQDVQTVFLDDSFREVDNEGSASYVREVSTSESGLFMVEVYYHPHQKLKMTGSYSDEELEKEEGLFTYYYRNGQVESKGMCSGGVKYGIWERFLWDGTPRPEKFYSGATVDELLNTQYRSSNAQFPGGEEELYAYIEENIQYPEQALEQKIEGEVIVSFVINEDGKVQNPSITQSAHYYLDKEAERLVANMPIWEPAVKGGYTLQSNFVLPITFVLPE